ncbi:MAG: YggT family protein [Gammaproteobacteria bacterium]|nr:YggT family protein [Gammaproteobacteria bacterium]
MSGGYFSNAGVFLIQTLFHLYILIVLLRLLLQLVRADFYNPLSQFLVKATNPVVVPLRRVIPGLLNIDLASVLLLLALKMTELVLLGLLAGHSWNIGSLLLVSVAELLGLLFHVFLFSILIQVILSWIRPGEHNPLTALLHSLNEPLLAPARRMVPPMGGLDLSPIVVLIALQLASMLIVAPLRALALG